MRFAAGGYRWGGRLPAEIVSGPSNRQAIEHALRALAAVLADIARASTETDDVAPAPIEAVPVGGNGSGNGVRPTDADDDSHAKGST